MSAIVVNGAPLGSFPDYTTAIANVFLAIGTIDIAYRLYRRIKEDRYWDKRRLVKID